MVETWMFGFAIAFIVLHLLGLGYLLFIRRFVAARESSDRLSPAGESSSISAVVSEKIEDDRGVDAPATADRAPDAELNASVDADESVRCRSCGVVNDAEYRFCRFCIDELDGNRSRMPTSTSPSSRGLF